MKPTQLSLILFSMLVYLAVGIVGEKPIRKRHENKNLKHQRKEAGVVFGRFIEEDVFDNASYSYSYSFSYSYSYPSVEPFDPTAGPSIRPSSADPNKQPTDVTGTPSDDTALTEEPSTTSPSTSSTEPKASPTLYPTLPLDVNSNDESPPPTSTSSPTVSNSDETPSTGTSSPTVSDSDEDVNTTVINSNPDTTINGAANNMSSGTAYIAPVVGLVAGALVIGVAMKAIDRVNGPTQYINLDADSESSFSLDA